MTCSSKAEAGTVVNNPPQKKAMVAGSTASWRVARLTNTEYNAQVRAAATSDRFPQNMSGESRAVRGSITATTPAVANASASTRVRVTRSPSSQAAKISTKAGVAEVTRAPLDAVDSRVPMN